MDSIAVVLVLYGIFIFIDLIPLIKKKKKKVLYLSIPIYLLTFIINLMSGLGFKFPYFNVMIQHTIDSIFHL